MHLKPTSIAVDSKIELGEMQNAFPPLASVHSNACWFQVHARLYHLKKYPETFFKEIHI
jgi:hypothetical protein